MQTLEIVTHQQLEGLLVRLGFVGMPIRDHWRAYQHSEVDGLLVLAGQDLGAPARPSDLDAVRRHLVGHGVIEEHDFPTLLVTAPSFVA